MHLQPDCVLTSKGFVKGLGVTIQDGRILGVQTSPPVGHEIVQMPNRAIMPGFINSHSHVFQRALRGLTESHSPGQVDANFWSWRGQMYALVAALCPEHVQIIAQQAYTEMLLAGYTTVKEFHYLHHAPQGDPYDNPHEMAHRIIAAAQDTGIAIHLLRVAYPNVDTPAQRRFADRDMEQALSRTDDLSSSTHVPVGIAPHSIRAVPPEGFRESAIWARSKQAECHAHVSEQPREIAWCLDQYGRRPLALIGEMGGLDCDFTGVHLTHLDPAEIHDAGSHHVTACICPTTEGNLGDGVPATRELLEAGASVAIGSDSQAEIDPFAEIRLLEYNERNRLGERRVLDPTRLLTSVCETTAPGSPARLLVLDRNHPALLGVPAEHLSGALVMGGRPSCIEQVWLGNQPVQPVAPVREYLQVLETIL